MPCMAHCFNVMAAVSYAPLRRRPLLLASNCTIRSILQSAMPIWPMRPRFRPHWLMSWTSAAEYKPRGRLIDIGCGPGLLLDLAGRQRSYAVQGCDISPWATQYPREQGLDVRTGDLHAVNYPSGQFDVAVVNHTLEHAP